MVPKVPPCLVIDSKGFYDAVTRSCCSQALSVERRLQIDYAIAKETVKNQNVLVFWVNNLRMCADCLTKLRGDTKPLFEILEGGTFHITICTQSGRKEKASASAEGQWECLYFWTVFPKERNSNAILAEPSLFAQELSFFSCLSIGCTEGNEKWIQCRDIQSLSIKDNGDKLSK